MRKIVGLVGTETDALHEFGDARLALGGGPDMVDVERRANDVLYPLPRVKRGKRVLEDDLHAAAIAFERRAVEAADFLAVELHPAAGRLDEAHEGKARRRFAAAAFADEAEGFTTL